jgi:GTPase SAR1 family protein
MFNFKYSSDFFNSKAKPKIEFASESVFFETSCNKAELNIWHTAGQEKYKSLTPGSLNGAQVAILVFDITSKIH